MKSSYDVLSGFWHRGEYVAPAPKGEPKRTITLTADEARHYVLDGSIALPPATPAADAE